MNLIIKISFTLVVMSLFIGCAGSRPTYAEQLKARPLPQTEQDKQAECAYIRQEVSRMQSTQLRAATMPCNPQYGACIGPAMMARANNNIASLESRAADIQCNAAFSSVIVANGNNGSIKECIDACKENTDRSPSECFDVCNK